MILGACAQLVVASFLRARSDHGMPSGEHIGKEEPNLLIPVLYSFCIPMLHTDVSSKLEV